MATRLEKKGYVFRQKDSQDKRITTISLTEKGKILCVEQTILAFSKPGEGAILCRPIYRYFSSVTEKTGRTIANRAAKMWGRFWKLPVLVSTGCSRPPAFWQTWGFCCIQRSVCQVFFHACPQLYRCEDPAQGCSVRERSHCCEIMIPPLQNGCKQLFHRLHPFFIFH